MFTTKIADHIFNINNLYPYIERLYNEYIVPFEEGNTVEISEEDIVAERQMADGMFSDEYLETLAVYRKICAILIHQNAVLFHCSALEMDGRAYLFTAPSGTGKSTHTRLWREYFKDRVKMINDDKPIIRFKEDGAYVYGTPYSGKHSLQTNTSAKIAGIVILHQDKENHIEVMDSRDAYPTLLSQTYRINEPKAIMKTLELVKKLSHLPVFSMGCTISYEAVDIAYNALKGNV